MESNYCDKTGQILPGNKLEEAKTFPYFQLREKFKCTVELQWLEHPWDYENLFETGVVRAIEGWL